MMKHAIVLLMVLLLVLDAGNSRLLAQDEDSAPAGGEQPGRAAQLTLDDLRTFTDVFNQARRNYVESVDDKTLLDAAIRGMLQELDPHSSYLPGEDYEDLNDHSKGRYSGVGVDVRARDGKIVVEAIINGSPADRAGINPGDTILAIDGEPLKGRYLPDAMDELLGEPGTEVTVVFLPEEGKQREVTMTREYIQYPTLSFELLDHDFGYFRITQFHKKTALDLEQTLDSIKADDIRLAGVIIDLRNNPGGVLNQAVAMADGFLDEGLIVSTRGRNSTMQMEFSAHSGQWLPGTPLMVLVDRGTASASEVVSGALQDHGRALIVGERTFGKGSVQSVLPLRNGGGIKLTTARYYTPSGRSIQAEGIVPDIVLDPTDPARANDARKREADLEGHLDREPPDRETTASTTGQTEWDWAADMLSVLKEAGILEGTPLESEAAEPEGEN